MARKLIIDADPGIGDALAIALAALDPSIDLIGVTATAGCVSGTVATQNILSVIEAVDPAKRPRLGASSGPRPQLVHDGCDAAGLLDPLRLNGNYGLGKAEVPFTALANQRESAKLMIDLVRNAPHEVTLLTLGPLTNVATAHELAPDFLQSLQRLVCMAGSIGVGGDVTAAAEFNVFSDPLAVRTILQTPMTRTFVPLDVTSRAVMSFEHFNRLKQVRPWSMRWFFDDLLPFALRLHHEELGLEGFPLREVAALASIAEPRHFEATDMSLDVELTGTRTRGATIFDRRRVPRWQTNVEVVVSADVQGVLDYVAGVLQQG